MRSGAVQITISNGMLSVAARGVTFDAPAPRQPSRASNVEAIEDCLSVLSMMKLSPLAGAHPVVGDDFSQQAAQRAGAMLQNLLHAERGSADLQTRLRNLLRW